MSKLTEKLTRIKENNISIKITEEIEMGGIVLQKGDKIKVLTESFDWQDIVDIINHERVSQNTKGLINFINQNQGKYKSEIKDFVDWFNQDIEDAEQADYIITKSKPSDTMDKLPSNDWSFFKKFASAYQMDPDDDKDLFRWMKGA